MWRSGKRKCGRTGARRGRRGTRGAIDFRIRAPRLSEMLLDLVQVVYWLALSTWFGGVLFIAAAAPVIIKTVKDADPLLPTVLSVNLEGQHGTLLAGGI